jgi:hypothetical protein
MMHALDRILLGSEWLPQLWQTRHLHSQLAKYLCATPAVLIVFVIRDAVSGH